MPDPIPKPTLDQSLIQIRTRLEGVFRRTNTAMSVVYVSAENLAEITGEPEVAEILTRSAGDVLCDQLNELTSIIEELGGTTSLTEEDDDEENPDDE